MRPSLADESRAIRGRVHAVVGLRIANYGSFRNRLHILLLLCLVRRLRVGNGASAAHRRSHHDSRAEQHQILDDVLTFQRRRVGKSYPSFGRKENKRQEGSHHLQEQQQQRQAQKLSGNQT